MRGQGTVNLISILQIRKLRLPDAGPQNLVFDILPRGWNLAFFFLFTVFLSRTLALYSWPLLLWNSLPSSLMAPLPSLE